MNHRHPIAPALTALACLAATASVALAQTQRWEYKSYLKDPVSGQYSKERFQSATVTVEEKGGKATFRMITSGRGDACIDRTELPAEVRRDEQTTTVTVLPPMVGCAPFRYVIRNDGSGGVRLHLRNEKWVSDGFDHGLTPLK